MDDNLAWCPVCDRQILPRFVPVNLLQPTATVVKPETHLVEAGAPIVLPPPVKTARPGLRKSRTATGRVKRVSPPKNNEHLRRISTQHNIADKTEKPVKKKLPRNNTDPLNPPAPAANEKQPLPQAPTKTKYATPIPPTNAPAPAPNGPTSGPMMVLDDGPLPLYCSEECRRIDQEGAVFDVDRSAADNSPRSIHDLKVDLPWSRPGLPTVQTPLPRNTSLPAFPFSTTTHPFTPLPPPPKPSEKELWQRRVHEEFVNGQRYKVEPWLNPEFRATIERKPAPRALEINDVLHAPGRTSRPSSYVGTVTFGPDEEVRTALGGEDGFRTWYYGEDARSLPAAYGMRKERPASVADKKPKAELSFARQPSATNLCGGNGPAFSSRPPSIKSRSNSRTRGQQALSMAGRTNANAHAHDDDEPWWIVDEQQDYAAYMDALAAEDQGGPTAGPLEGWLKMREARRRERFEREEKAERRRSLSAALSAGNSNTSLAPGTMTPLLMRRVSSSRNGILQYQAQSKPATRPPSPPTVAESPVPMERHISLNDPSPPYRISIIPRRHSLRAPYTTNKDANVHVQQTQRRFSRDAPGAASPRSPLGLHTISRQSLEDVTVIPPPIDFLALKLDAVLSPAPVPEPTPVAAPAPAPESPPVPTATVATPASTSLAEKRPPRRTRPARPRGLSAISYLRPLEPIVLPNVVKAVPSKASGGPVAALAAEADDITHDHEPGHASGNSGSDSSGTLVSCGSGSTRVGCNSHEGHPPSKHPALDVGKMSKVDEVREDGELSKSPAEQSLSRAFAAGHHQQQHQNQRRSRSPGAMFTRPMSLVWSSGQDVQKPHSQGRVEENTNRRHSLWVLFGSVRS